MKNTRIIRAIDAHLERLGNVKSKSGVVVGRKGDVRELFRAFDDEFLVIADINKQQSFFIYAAIKWELIMRNPANGDKPTILVRTIDEY